MHNITDPSKVRFSGPLACGLAQQFAGLGYTPTSAAIQLQLAADSFFRPWTARPMPSDPVSAGN
jgi:hypothetical protein